MVLPEKEEAQLIEAVCNELVVNNEMQEQQVKTLGKYLIEEGGTVDKMGNPLQPGIYYMWPRTVMVPVNHARRIRHIIENAKTLDEMQTEIAKHMCKYGKPSNNNNKNE